MNDARDTASYVAIPMDQETLEAMPGFRIGSKVRQAHGIHAGREGQVIVWGRSRRADQQFRENMDAAKAGGRELSSDDYEILIDNEGPVVRFNDGTEHWFPGQSMGVLEAADPQFIVVMTLTVPDKDWRAAYGPQHGPIPAGDVRNYLIEGLFAGSTHLDATVHEVRVL